MKRIWQLTCLLGFIASSAFAQTDFKMAVQAKIESGIIEGDYNTQTGIQSYFGVPFAKPPVGDLRWKAPVPAEPWSGVKKTKAFGPRPIHS